MQYIIQKWFVLVSFDLSLQWNFEMSEWLSFLSEAFNKEVIFFLRGLSRADANHSNAFSRRQPTPGIAKQIVLLAMCWAGLKYLHVTVDWQTVWLLPVYTVGSWKVYAHSKVGIQITNLGQFHKAETPKFVLQNANIFMAFSLFNFIKALTPKFSQDNAKKWWRYQSSIL